MLIREVMSKKPAYVPPDTSLKQAAAEMQKNDFGFLPVGDHDRLVGVVTDRDLTIRATSSGKDPNKTCVKEVMTKKVLYCFEDDEVEEAAKNMGAQQIHRLIVLNRDKRMTGVVSLGDIARKCRDAKLSGSTYQKVEKE